MSTFRSNSALDNVAASNYLGWITTTDSYGDRSVWFLGSTDFAERQAGIIYRAYINETVEIVVDHFDYNVDAHIIDTVDYGNGTIETFTLSNAPDFMVIFGWVEIAGILNAQIANYDNGAPSALEKAQYDILTSVERIDWNTETESFTAMNEDASFAFSFVKNPNDDLVRMVVL